MVWTPVSTCTCRISEMCEKAWGSARSLSSAGTEMALALCRSCPLCSACIKHWRTTRLKQLHSCRVSQMGSARIPCALMLTNSSSHPKVLCLPMSGRLSITAFSNSLRRSNSCSSIGSWISSFPSQGDQDEVENNRSLCACGCTVL